jgi:mono/diheme cytochrome c family protein
MKKLLKWTGIIFGGLIVLTLLAGLALYPIGMKKLTKTYPNITVETVNIPTDADAIARGRHVATIWACTKCHGEDLSGKIITNDPITGTIPIFGTIPVSNLTSGKGGVSQSYTDTDWVRAIRHGVKPNSQAEIFMYVSTISDQDLGDLIAYLKQIPSVDKDLPAISYGPIVPIFPAVGIFTPAAELIDHNAPRPADPAPGETVEYGRYLSAICAECHGAGIANAMKNKNWKQEDFIRTFNTGVLPDGKKLSPTMSSNTFRELNDAELTALWLYFTSGNP